MLALIPRRHNEPWLDFKQAVFRSALDIRLLAGETKQEAVAHASDAAGLWNPVVPPDFWA